MALYGYARVSTSDQDCTLQEQALRAAGVPGDPRRKSLDRPARPDRTGAAAGVSPARGYACGHRVDRLARSIKDLQDIVHLLKEQGVTLRATEQPINTQSASGKPFWTCWGCSPEFETNLRRERQLEGIAAAKARGVYRGRKPSIDPADSAAPRGGTLGRVRHCAAAGHWAGLGLSGARAHGARAMAVIPTRLPRPTPATPGSPAAQKS